MKLIRPFLLCCCLWLVGTLNAQDMHWTLFNYSPLSLNPAFTGAYEGSFRLGGIMRDQAPTASYTPNTQFPGQSTNVYFPAYSFYADAPIITGFRKQDWVGIGAMFYSDQAGDLELGLSYALGSVSYHIGLDKKQKNVFTIGVQAGIGSRNLNAQNLAFALDIENNPNFVPGQGSAYGAVYGDPSDPRNRTFFDLNAGVLLRSKVNKTTGFNMGLSARHIAPAKYFLITGNENRDSATNNLPLIISLHSQLDVKMNKKWSITPAIMLQNASPSTEVQLQAMMGYQLNPKKANILNFGLGYRLGDAAQFLLGMDSGPFRIAASFDLGLGALSEINQNIGAFELGVSYIGRIYKDPAVKPVIFCPRF